METVLDSLVSSALTVLLQSTVILGGGLLVGLILRGNAGLRYPVLLAALVFTVLAGVLAVWNPGQMVEIRLGTPAAVEDQAFIVPAAVAKIPATVGDEFESVVVPEEIGGVMEKDEQRADQSREPLSAERGVLTALSWRTVGVGVVALWVLGSVFQLVRLLVGLRAVRRLVREAVPIPIAQARRIWLEVSGAIGVSVTSPGRILVSRRLTTPIVLGIFRPAMVVPDAMKDELAGPRLRAIFAHEMAHLLRRDPLAGMLERWAKVLLWPQPLLRIHLRALDRAREEICDNYALVVSDRRAYGRLLLDLAEQPTAGCPPFAAMGLLQKRWNLEHRISEILNPERNTMTRLAIRQWITPTAVVAAIALMAAGTRFSLAAPEEERSDEVEQRESRSPEREREHPRGEERAERDGERFEAQVRELKGAMREAAERGQHDRAEELEGRLKELLASREGRERGARDGGEREAQRDGERFEAQVRELKGAMREAAERGQHDRAEELEGRLKELLASREGRERGARDGREREAQRDGERFEAQVRELKGAMREAAERGEERRAEELEGRLKELLASREGRERGARDGGEREAQRDGERFEAQVRELKGAMREAAERGQHDRAEALEGRLKELLASREGRDRGARDGGEREAQRDGERFEAQVRELKGAIHSAAERGQRDRAHQLELQLKKLVEQREHAAREEGEPRDGERQERAAQLERRMKEMAQHMEEMQRAMREMQRELARLRGGDDR